MRSGGGAVPNRPESRELASRYLNRELSWLRFNTRVLEEAGDSSLPLLERVKFLSIYHRNLDEFFMIRVSGLRARVAAGVVDVSPDGYSAGEQLESIREYLVPELERAEEIWLHDLYQRLHDHRIEVLDTTELEPRERADLRELFEREVFPILTPLAFDPGHPFPHISSLSVNLAVVVRDVEHGERFARVKVPQTLPRLLEVRRPVVATDQRPRRKFAWLDQVVADNLDLLFPGLEIVGAYSFRVTRDADLEIEEDEASDLLEAVSDFVDQRHFGKVVRLEIDSRLPADLRQVLADNLELAESQVYSTHGPIGLSALDALAALEIEELHDPVFLPDSRGGLAERGYFAPIAERDVLLYHPYDAFATVVDFLRAAANDPQVLAIKQTLYRVGSNSPIVEALMEARENGKQVSVLVELKARFDEEKNIGWARALDQAGVHVVYGFVGLKTHAKMLLVVRREAGGLRSYVHLGTGNYNSATARSYADLGYFTADPETGRDVATLFNALTGYSRENGYRRLLVAPATLRTQLLQRIDREVEQASAGAKARLVFKLNALVDYEIIEALYRASEAGVKIDLQVRGICCLRPGVAGMSENIRVTSLVGRFLEHTRIFYFFNGGDEEILLGSADLMPRNLDRRVEVLFPVRDAQLRDALRDEVLERHLVDNTNTQRLLPSGEYAPVFEDGVLEGRVLEDGVRRDSHAELVSLRGGWRFAIAAERGVAGVPELSTRLTPSRPAAPHFSGKPHTFPDKQLFSLDKPNVSPDKPAQKGNTIGDR